MTNIPNTLPDSRDTTILDAPDKMVSVRDLFGIDTDMAIKGFADRSRCFAERLKLSEKFT